MQSITDEWRQAAANFRENNPRYTRQDGFLVDRFGNPVLFNGQQVFMNP